MASGELAGCTARGYTAGNAAKKEHDEYTRRAEQSVEPGLRTIAKHQAAKRACIAAVTERVDQPPLGRRLVRQM